ncbi:MAG: creatininase family protein [Mahellales bacterium]
MAETKKRYNLAQLAWPDIQEFLKESDVVMIPFGSCELHGAHLPLGTDTYQCLAITQRAAELCNVPYTEPLMYGYSPHHIRQPESGMGTITLRASTLNAVLYDIARSLIHHGFNKLVFVCGHASNMKITDPLMRQLRYETGALIAMVRPWAERYLGIIEEYMEGPPEETPGWHSGELETCQVMAYDESLVRMDRAKIAKAHAPEWLPDGFTKTDGLPTVSLDGYEYFSFPMEHQEFAPDGIMGNPFRATPEKGRKCIEAYASHIAKAINLLKPLKWDHKIKQREFINRV